MPTGDYGRHPLFISIVDQAHAPIVSSNENLSVPPTKNQKFANKNGSKTDKKLKKEKLRQQMKPAIDDSEEDEDMDEPDVSNGKMVNDSDEGDSADDVDSELASDSEEEESEDDASSVEEQSSKQVKSLPNGKAKKESDKSAKLSKKNERADDVDADDKPNKQSAKKASTKEEPDMFAPMASSDEEEDSDDDLDEDSDNDNEDSDDDEDESAEDDDSDADDDQTMLQPKSPKSAHISSPAKTPKSILKKTATPEQQTDKKDGKSANKVVLNGKKKCVTVGEEKQNVTLNSAASDTPTKSKVSKDEKAFKSTKLPADNELFLKHINPRDEKTYQQFTHSVVLRKLPITETEEQLRKLAPDAIKFGYIGQKMPMTSVVFKFADEESASAFIKKIQTEKHYKEKLSALKFVPLPHLSPQTMDPLRIYVGNIPVHVSKETLSSLFPENKSITLIRNSSSRSKWAYAFVEFNDPQPVKKYLDLTTEQTMTVDGYTLFIKEAVMRSSDGPQTPQQQGSPNAELDLKALYVSNLPIIVSPDQLKTMFPNSEKISLSTGDNRNQRFGRKSRSRFAYVYFKSEQDCADALKANILATMDDRQLCVCFKTTSFGTKHDDSFSLDVSDVNKSDVSLTPTSAAKPVQKRKHAKCEEEASVKVQTPSAVIEAPKSKKAKKAARDDATAKAVVPKPSAKDSVASKHCEVSPVTAGSAKKDKSKTVTPAAKKKVELDVEDSEEDDDDSSLDGTDDDADSDDDDDVNADSDEDDEDEDEEEDDDE